MTQIKQCDIHASFLVPSYNLPNGMLSNYITTQQGITPKGSIFIDVWMVRATKGQAEESMMTSLRTEEQRYSEELKKLSLSEQTNETKTKIAQLEHGKKVFANLVETAANSVYKKKADAEFLEIAKRNFAQPSLSIYEPDLKNYVYLAGIYNYIER